MPAILAPQDYAVWLDPAREGAALAELLAPLASDALSFRPVGARVNRVENDDATCIAPVPEPPRQPSLF